MSRLVEVKWIRVYWNGGLPEEGKEGSIRGKMVKALPKDHEQSWSVQDEDGNERRLQNDGIKPNKKRR